MRQALRASVEEYSLKKVEALYDFRRSVDLKEAGVQLRRVQRALELVELADASDERRARARLHRASIPPWELLAAR